jgi:hypothetical protein
MKKHIVSLIVVLIFLLIFINPSISYEINNKQTVLLLYSSNDAIGMEIFENTKMVLQTNDISYAYFDISKTNNLPSIRNFSIVVISTEMIYTMNREAKTELKDYTKNGGKVVQLIRSFDKGYSEVFGIDTFYEPEFIISNGITFYYDIFPGIKNFTITPSECYDISSFSFTLEKNINIIASSYEGIPLVWENVYGKGKTIFWNSTFLSIKDYEGLIIDSITTLLDFSARKVYALGGIFVDDMPSPSWKIIRDPIETEYNITDSEYYYNILIPDLIELAKKYNLKYTTAAIFAYNDKTTPPFDFGEWNNSNIKIGDQIFSIPEEIIKVLKINSDIFEIGFHGYNHQPFTLSKWGNVSNMYSALRAAKEKWNQTIGTYPLVYVPPMNVVDQVGFDATINVFDNIRIFSSLFQEALDEGCDREFGPELWNNEITAIPRISSGYSMSPYEMLKAFSMIEAYGIWTHFLHPDDVFSTPVNLPTAEPDWIRNPLSLPWRGDKTNKNGLYYKFEDSIKLIKESYPWLKYEKASNISKKISSNFNDTQSILVTDYYMEFYNLSPETYILEIPSSYELEKNDNFSITSSMIYSNKKRIVIELSKGCKIYFKNISS